MSSNLQGFLNKFNSAQQKYVDTIDPLNTFDVTFKFWPKIDGSATKKSSGFADKLGKAVMNIGNNVTGGLLGAMMNDVDVFKLRDDFTGDSNFGKTTFLDYVARGNLLVEDGQTTPQLTLDLSYYIQDITLPQFALKEEAQAETMMGEFPVTGYYVKPSSNNATFNVINTKAPLMERLFYPWMREVSTPFWNYETQPYTTADIVISFKKHSDIQYILVGSRPSNIESWKPSNELQSPTRQVQMVFDYMFVTSNMKSMPSAKDMLKSAGKSLLGGAAKTIGL